MSTDQVPEGFKVEYRKSSPDQQRKQGEQSKVPEGQKYEIPT